MRWGLDAFGARSHKAPLFDQENESSLQTSELGKSLAFCYYRSSSSVIHVFDQNARARIYQHLSILIRLRIQFCNCSHVILLQGCLIRKYSVPSPRVHLMIVTLSQSLGFFQVAYNWSPLPYTSYPTAPSFNQLLFYHDPSINKSICSSIPQSLRL